MNPGSRIVIWRHSSEGYPDPGPFGRQVNVSFDEFKHWIRTGRVLRHLFRYDEALELVYDVERVGKRFASLLLLRLLARQGAVLRDGKGREVRAGWLPLVHGFFKLLREGIGCRGAVRRAEGKLASLEGRRGEPPRMGLDLSGTPVYLRTDLTYGLRAGGPVAHTAGVLNHLEGFSSRPLFLTTDALPGVRPGLETRVLDPGRRFWDYGEVLTLNANGLFADQVHSILRGRKVSFLYQRYSLDNFTGAQVARDLGVPLVLEFNCPEVWASRRWNRGLRYESMARRIERINLDLARLVVTVSDSLGNFLEAEGVPRKKILVCPNGVDADRYHPGAGGGRVRAAYGLEGKTVIGFIGSFGAWHGAEALCGAFARLLEDHPALRERVRLLMVGDGERLPEAKAVLKKRGLEALGVFTGTVDQEQGPAYLDACDVLASFAVPHGDGTDFIHSPVKLFEYMAMGKAVVATRLGQVGGLLSHGENALLVEPGDGAGMVAALRRLVEDGGLRAGLGRAARAEALAKHGWDRRVREIVEALERSCA